MKINRNSCWTKVLVLMHPPPLPRLLPRLLPRWFWENSAFWEKRGRENLFIIYYYTYPRSLCSESVSFQDPRQKCTINKRKRSKNYKKPLSIQPILDDLMSTDRSISISSTKPLLRTIVDPFGFPTRTPWYGRNFIYREGMGRDGISRSKAIPVYWWWHG